MDEWAAEHDVRLSPEISRETLVVRNIEDAELEALLPSIFDAELIDGQWTRDDTADRRRWRDEVTKQLQAAAKARSAGTGETWASEWKTLATDRYFNRRANGRTLAETVLDTFLAEEEAWTEAVPPASTGSRRFLEFALPSDIARASTEVLAASRRLPLSDSPADAAFRRDFAWPVNPDGVVLTWDWSGPRLNIRATLWGGNQYLGDTIRQYAITSPGVNAAQDGASFLVPGDRNAYAQMASESGSPLGWLTMQLYPDVSQFVAVLSAELEGDMLDRWSGEVVQADVSLNRLAMVGLGMESLTVQNTRILKPTRWAPHIDYRLRADAVNRFALAVRQDVTHQPYIALVQQAGTTYGWQNWLHKWRGESPGCAPLGPHTDAEFLGWTSQSLFPKAVAEATARALLFDELGTPNGLTPRLQAAVRRGDFNGVRIDFPTKRDVMHRYRDINNKWSHWFSSEHWTTIGPRIAENDYPTETREFIIGRVEVSDGEQTVVGEPVILSD